MTILVRHHGYANGSFELLILRIEFVNNSWPEHPVVQVSKQCHELLNISGFRVRAAISLLIGLKSRRGAAPQKRTGARPNKVGPAPVVTKGWIAILGETGNWESAVGVCPGRILETAESVYFPGAGG